MDSTTAISYINRMGGTHSYTLPRLACNLGQWCLNSRTFHSSAEWQLHQGVFSKYSTPVRSVSSGHLRHTIKPSASPVCELVAGPICHGYRCTPSLLDRPDRLCIPTVLSGRHVLTESETGTESSGPGSTVWPSQAWYPLQLGRNGLGSFPI